MDNCCSLGKPAVLEISVNATIQRETEERVSIHFLTVLHLTPYNRILKSSHIYMAPALKKLEIVKYYFVT